MYQSSLIKQSITSEDGTINPSASLQEEISTGVESEITKYGIDEFGREYPKEANALKDLFIDYDINFRVVRKFLYKYSQLWGDLLAVLKGISYYGPNNLKFEILPNIITFLEASDKHTLIDILKLIPVLGDMNTSRIFEDRFDESQRMMEEMKDFGKNKEMIKPINRGMDGHYLLDILSEFPDELDQLIKQDVNAYRLLGQYGKEILDFLRNYKEIWGDILRLELQTGHFDTIFSSLEDIGRFLNSKEAERWRRFIDYGTTYHEILAAIKYLLLYPESIDLVDSLHEKIGDHYVGFLQEGVNLGFIIELFDNHRAIWDNMTHYAKQSGVSVAKYIGRNAEKIIHYANVLNWDNIKELIEVNMKQGPEILKTLHVLEEMTDECSDDEYEDFYQILYAGQYFDVDFFNPDILEKLQSVRKMYPNFYSLVVPYILKFDNKFTSSDYLKFIESIADYCVIYGTQPESMQVLKKVLESKNDYSMFINFAHLSVSTYVSFGIKPDILLEDVDKIVSKLASLHLPELSYQLVRYFCHPQELQKIFLFIRDGKLDPQYIFRINNRSGGEGWIMVLIKGITSLPEETFQDLLRQIPRVERHLIYHIEQFIRIQNFHLLVRGLGKTLGSLISIGSTRLEYLLQTEVINDKISEGLIVGLGHFLYRYEDSWKDLLKYVNKENITLTELLIRQPDVDKLYSIITYEQSLPSDNQTIRMPKITPYKRIGYRRGDKTNPFGNYIGYTSDNSRLLEGVTGSSETLEGILHDPNLPRYERLTRFKKAYRDVFTLLAKITTEMIEYLSGSFDKYKSEQEALEDVFLEFGNSLKLLPSAMLSMLIGGLQIYIQKGFSIRNILNDPKYNNNPAKLLSDSLGVDIGKLRGMVSVDTDGANFVFYISNEHDYYLFYARGDSQKAHLEMIKSPSGGFSTSYSKIPQLQKTITCVNGLKGSDRYIETTKVHESRHTINSLIMPDYGSGDHLTRAKDEILSYMTDGRVWEMDRILFKTGDGALYDYYDNHKGERDGNYAKFRSMYESELSRAVQIAKRFYLENIPNHINLLALVPVRQWGQLYSVYFL